MTENGGILLDTINSTEFKLYKYRWFILFLFCLYTCANFAQYLQYSIITNIIAKYYGVGTFTVSWSTLVFMIEFIVLFVPVSYLMEKYDLRKISILTTFLTAVGCIIKIFSISPDLYYVVLIGQSLCGIAQVFMMSLTSKVAAVWFGKDEVSTACACAVFGTQLGVAIGCIVPPYVVKNHDNVEQIGDELFDMNLYNAIINSAVSIVVFLFFEAKPKTPPSASQMLIWERQEHTEYLQSLKKLVVNRDYLILLLVIGLSNGIWNSRTTFIILLLSSIAFLVTAFLLEKEARIPVFISVAAFGFNLAGSLVVGFEYAVELTYPEPEATTLALLNSVILFFGLIFAVVLDALFTSWGYFETNICVSVILCGCAFLVFGISPNLKRLEANKNEN